MKKITIGIIAHVDSGKTTLSEALLFKSNAIRKFGRVDKGESFLDGNEIERKRGITIYSKTAAFDWKDVHFTMIDTPGHVDFSAEMERALRVLDYCVLIISAPDEIKEQTAVLYKLTKQYNVPTFVFFNKMDRCLFSKEELIENTKAALNDNFVDFTKTRDDEFFDECAMGDEAAMEEYLESGALKDETIQRLIDMALITPCFFGSALHLDGIEEFADALCEYTSVPEYNDEFSARVFKIQRDEKTDRLTFLKITGGMLKSRTVLKDGDGFSKINQIRIYQGDKYTLVNEVSAGDVCAVTGLKETKAGDSYGEGEEFVGSYITPKKALKAVFDEKTDPKKVLPYFKMLEEENPEFGIYFDESRYAIYVGIMGQVQLEVLISVLKERFNLDVYFTEIEDEELEEEIEEIIEEEEEKRVNLNDASVYVDDEIYMGIEEIDAIVDGISRRKSSKHEQQPGWKRHYKRLEDDKANKLYKGSADVFSFESADYLLIDGYNVIFAWDELAAMANINVDAARIDLLEAVSNYKAMTNSEIIVVFDAYRVKNHNTEMLDYNNIHVVFTKEAETADHFIEVFAHEHKKKDKVAVVTSDGLEQIIIRGEGAALISSREFKEKIESLNSTLREQYNL